MYARVYEQIFSSSIMEEDLETRYIWFCLLTLSDRDGFVDMTIPAIARRINLQEEVVSKSIDKFMLPDPSSRTDTQEGRRLEKIRESFGWKIINYIHYRDLRNEENRREYMREYMRGKRNVNKKVNRNVNKLTVSTCKLPLATTATATATATATTTKDIILKFDSIWKKYPKRVGRKEAEKHYKVSVKTEQDYFDLLQALENYLKAETVKKGFVQNGSTWFNNWKDWIDYEEPKQKTQAERDKELADKLRKEMGEIL